MPYNERKLKPLSFSIYLPNGHEVLYTLLCDVETLPDNAEQCGGRDASLQHRRSEI